MEIIIWGLLIAGAGTMVVIFTEPIYHFTGAIGVIEDKLPGGTKGVFKIIGVIMVIVGILMFTGTAGYLFGPMGEWLLGLIKR